MTKYPKINTLYNRDPKTFLVTDEIRLPEFSNIKKWLVTEKIDGCLHYAQTILTNKGRIPIGRIVNKRLPVRVASYNQKLNTVEFREIEHYHKEERVRPFLSIGVRSRLKGSREKFIVCTDNHKFFSNGKWIEAKDLKKGIKLSHFKGAPCAITPTINQYLGLLETEVTSINETFPKRASSLKPMNKYQYDLTIEGNSNYFASSILVHNTNIRVQYERSKMLIFRGRTDKAQIPTFLLEKLKEMFPVDKVHNVFTREDVPPERMIQNACLYGEGYGPRINKGGVYRPKEEGVSFRLIDVWVDGWWLRWDSVKEIAKALDIHTVPVLAPHTLREAVYLIKPNEDGSGLKSVVAVEDGGNPETRMEGIVARAYPMVLFRKGNPVVWKLKVKDFGKGEKNE